MKHYSTFFWEKRVVLKTVDSKERLLTHCITQSRTVAEQFEL